MARRGKISYEGGDMWARVNRELAKSEELRATTPDTSYSSVFKEAWDYGFQLRQEKDQDYAREVARVNTFQSKIDRQIENVTRSGQIYNDSEIAKIRESLKSTYDADSDRFPELRSELTDVYDSRIASISEFSRRNKEWANLENETPLAMDNLLKLTEQLSETEWDDLSQESKLSFKDKLMEQTQKVANLKRILKDPYNQSRQNYSQLGANISGISNGKLSLLTQLSTFDPGKTVITEGEMQAMTQAIQNDDPSLISAFNNEGVKRKVERANMMEASIKKDVAEYESLVEYYNSPEYMTLKSSKDEEEKEYINKGKTLPEDFWIVLTEDGEINLKDKTNELRKRMDDVSDVNESYRRENIQGFSYKESFDVDFPWDIEPTAAELSEMQKYQEEIKKGEMKITDLPKKYLGEVPKLDTKSFDAVVDYASKLDTKKDIYTALLNEKVPNYYYLSNTIFKLKNLEKKYGKDSEQYKKTYNKSKKSWDVSQISGLPYFRRKEEPSALQKLHKRSAKKKAGAIR